MQNAASIIGYRGVSTRHTGLAHCPCQSEKTFKIRPNRARQEVHMKLRVAPAAQTSDSIAIVWEKPMLAEQVEEYQIFLNGKEAVRVKDTDYTFENLEPDTEYSFRVRAVVKPGIVIPESNLVKGRTKPVPQVFSVRDYGAAGDGITMDTEAIQKTIDACCDGGMVYLPKGIYKSGALFLKSRMTLFVEEGATLLGSEDPEDYPLISYLYEGYVRRCHASLISSGMDGAFCTDITIAGKGTINGSGNHLLRAELDGGKGRRGNLICLQNTDNIYMKDITVRQSPFWCVHMIYCSHISMNRITIHTKYDENGNIYGHIFNGDGFDPDSCRDVCLFHSYISSQDDCIAVKSGRDAEGRAVGIPSEDIRITNCRFKSGFGVAMGSEMAGGIRNVLVQDCVFEDSFSIASVKAPRGRGAFIENVLYDNCSLINRDRTISSTIWFKGAVYVDCYYGEKEYDHQEDRPIDEGTPVIQDIHFRNLTSDTEEGHAIYMAGLPESPLRNITFEHIRGIGQNGLFAQSVEGLSLKDVQVSAREGDDMRFKNVKGVAICE